MTSKWLAVAGVAALVAGAPPVPAQDVPERAPLPVEASASGQPVFETDEQKLDYGLGVQMGRNLRNQGLEPDVDRVVRGLRDALAGRRPAISEEELRQTLRTFGAEVRRNRVRNQRIAAEDNLKAGEAFLEENKKKDGVVTLPSGLQYQVVTQGTGPMPTDADTVEVHYRGTLIDGTEFDSSFRNDRPAAFVVKASIPGWRQALQRMPVGSRWQLFVPPGLAYGPRGTGLGVGPNATLTFDVELLAIKSARAGEPVTER